MDPKTTRFHEAAARVRKFDGNIAIGMASNSEIARLEKLADQFEDRERASRLNEPLTAGMTALSGLWSRYHQLRSDVLNWQAELRRYPREMSVLGTPVGYYTEPEAIPSTMPSFRSAAEYETYNAKFSHRVAELELKVTKLKDYCQQWTRLTPDQQNRKLILAIADRI
jgi:hypothetical protein